MAQGKSAQSTVSEVRSVCHGLEISPSCNTSKTSNIYAGGGHTVKQAKHGSGGKSASKGSTPQKFGAAHSKKGH